MIYTPEISINNVIQADPTLKFFLRETTLDFDKLEHQVNIMCSCVVIAINKYLDVKYK